MITELNDHGFTDEATTTKVRALQRAIWDIEGREPWPFLERTVDLTFDGTNSYPTNTNLNVRSVRRLTDTNGNRLRYLRVEDYDDTVAGHWTQTGVPQYYWLEGTQINLWPIPAASYTAKLRYIQWSVEITSSTAETAFLIPKYYHRVVVSGALRYLYDMEDDDLAPRYQALYEKELADMRTSVWQRQVDRPNVIRKSDPDDRDPYSSYLYL